MNKFKITKTGERYFFTQEISREEAINFINKQDTHSIEIKCEDKRVKTYDQIKLF